MSILLLYFSSYRSIKINVVHLKVVSAAFLIVCFLCLKENTCETRKNVSYFTSKALFVHEIMEF